MRTEELLEYQWPYLLACLPALSLDESAAQYGALTRRRAVDSASTLLRLSLAYGFCGLSLRAAAAWAEAADVAAISDVALLKRLRKAGAWLGYLFAAKLADSAPPPQVSPLQRRIKLVDATTISRAGSRGTDYRLHLNYDLTRHTFEHLELTDSSGGETLQRFSFAPGDLVLADRGYSRRAGLHHVLEAGADFLVRLSWASVPLETLAGAAVDLLDVLRELPEAQPQAFPLQAAAVVRSPVPVFPATLVALRRSEAAADEARRRILLDQPRRGGQLKPRTLEMAGYVCLLTSLSPAQLSAAEAFELYRFRWQAELVFKRLKGLLALDALPAKDPALVQTLIYAKLLAALILDDFTGRFLRFFPWGYRVAPVPALHLAH